MQKEKLKMKDIKICSLVSVCFFILLISGTFSPRDTAAKNPEYPDIISIAVDIYPPSQSPTLKFFGSTPRILTEAFESEGIKVKYKWYPWKRCISHGMSGECDAVALGSRNSEREKFFWFSEPVVIAKTVFFHHKDYSFDWNTTDDLKGRRIGIIRGYIYGDLFQNAKKNLTINEVTTSAQNMKKLYTGRIDITPIDLFSGVFMLKTDTRFEKYSDSIIYHPKPIQIAEWCLMFSKKVKKNKRRLELFNRGLNRLKEKGVHEQYIEEAIKGKYGLK